MMRINDFDGFDELFHHHKTALNEWIVFRSF